MPMPIKRRAPARGTSENVQTTFMMSRPDRTRLLYAAAVRGETPSQYLRRAVAAALAADPAISAAPAPATEASTIASKE